MNSDQFLASVVVRTIHAFVRDPMFAVNTACNDYDSVDSWIKSQAGQSMGVGVAAALGPAYAVARNAKTPLVVILSLLLTLIDLSTLVNKVAYVGQGIAGLRKCPIDKEQSEVDLAVILALWTRAVIEEDLDAMFEAEAKTGQMVVPDQRKVSPKNEFLECPLQTTSQIILVDKGGTKMLAVLGNAFLRRLTVPLFGQLGLRGMAKVATEISVVGAGASGIINYKMISAVGRCGDVYYTKKRAFLDRNNGTKTAA